MVVEKKQCDFEQKHEQKEGGNVWNVYKLKELKKLKLKGYGILIRKSCIIKNVVNLFFKSQLD